MHYRHLGAIFTILAASTIPCFGQAGRAELFGMITDPSNAAVPEAKVELVGKDTGARFTTVAGAGGAYHLIGIPVGEYSLNVQKTGFRAFQQVGLDVPRRRSKRLWTCGWNGEVGARDAIPVPA